MLGGNCGRYVPTGYLMDARAGALLALPFDLARPRRQVSSDGGSAPGWARSGRELFFRSDTRLMVAGVNPVTGATEKPRLLFDVPGFTDQMDFAARYDVAPDGQSFVVITDTPRPALTKINVVLNWFEERKRRVPGDAGAR